MRQQLRSNWLATGEQLSPEVFETSNAFGTSASTASPLRDFVHLLWQGRWIMLAALLSVVGVVGAYVYFVSPEYEAYSLLWVETEQRPLQGLQFGGEDAYGLIDRSLEGEVWKLRRSYTIAERVADTLLALQTLPETGEPLPILFDEEGQAVSRGELALRLMNRIQIYPDGVKVNGIRIVSVSTVPGEAALIANAYAEAYIARTQESSLTSIHSTRLFLEGQEAKLQKQLESIEQQIEEYMSREGAAGLDNEASSMISQIAQIQSSLDLAQVELETKRVALQAREQELREIEPRLVNQVASSGEQEQLLKATQEQIAEIELNLENIYLHNPELRERPSEEVQQIQRRVATLREKAKRISAQHVEEGLSASGAAGMDYVASLRTQVAEDRIALIGAQSKVNLLQNRLREHEAKLKTIPSQLMELAQLRRAQQTTEKLYTYLLEDLQEARIAEESEVGYAEVIRPAYTPYVPVRPNVPLSLILAVFTGLMLGCGLVLLRERLNTRLRHPRDLIQQGYSVIGVIPDIRPVIKSNFLAKQQIAVNDHVVSTSLIMLLNPASPTAEAYRRLRTNIQFGRPGAAVQTLMLCSPEKGEGKSTTSLNLAVAIAQAGRRTVIIDADLRHPQLHGMLGLSREPGLSELLSGFLEFEPELFETYISDLYVIPAGRSVPNPAELLGSWKMHELIEQLRGIFDTIIFDTPPVLTFTDAMPLSTQCDATVVVAAAGQTNGVAFEHAVKALQGVGAVIIGSTLNKVDSGQNREYGYYGYNTTDSL